MQQLAIIARIHTDLPEKFGIPRQSGLAPALTGRIIFEPEYRDPSAIRGLEAFSHIWLIWHFSMSELEHWSPTVKPPKLGGNRRMGVFATRSPFRPNPLGLSCVKLDKVEASGKDGPTLLVSGVDLMDGTPIFDIKPYLPYADCYPDAAGGFTDSIDYVRLNVDFPPALLRMIPSDKQEALFQLLSQDPRPGYRSEDDGHRYGVSFAGWNVCFTVCNGTIFVQEVAPLREKN